MQFKLILILIMLFSASLAFAFPDNMAGWCTTTPSYKPGCLKYLNNQRSVALAIENEIARCVASSFISASFDVCPLYSEVTG